MEAIVDAFYHPSMLERLPDLVDRALIQQAALPQAPHAYERQLHACFNHEPNRRGSPGSGCRPWCCMGWTTGLAARQR